MSVALPVVGPVQAFCLRQNTANVRLKFKKHAAQTEKYAKPNLKKNVDFQRLQFWLDKDKISMYFL